MTTGSLTCRGTSEENMSEPTICVNCQHFNETWVTGYPPWSISGWEKECKMGPVDYVTGGRTSVKASEKNTNGNCPDFVRKAAS